MIARCYEVDHASYPRYGGRGITVCDRWRDSFKNFAEDLGDRTMGMTFGRIDNDGDYEPENVRWETYQQQARNTSRNRALTFRGETRLICEWEEVTGLSQKVISERLRIGWGIERTLTEPVEHHGPAPTAEQKKRVQQLRAQGLSYTKIGVELGRPRTTIRNWIKRWEK